MKDHRFGRKGQSSPSQS